MGRDHVDASGGEQHLFAPDRHFQFAFYDIGDLFIDMVMFRGDAPFFYVPEDKGTAVAVNHFTGETGEGIFDRDLIQVLHTFVLPKVQKKWG